MPRGIADTEISAKARWQYIKENIETTEKGCWEYQVTGKTVTLKFEGRYEYIHNIMFIVMSGGIDRKLDRDHLCFGVKCINPFHIEQVTHQVNVRRGNAGGIYQRRITHCPQGHEYDKKNTYYTKDEKRMCRACARNRQTLYRVRKLYGEKKD